MPLFALFFGRFFSKSTSYNIYYRKLGCVCLYFKGCVIFIIHFFCKKLLFKNVHFLLKFFAFFRVKKSPLFYIKNVSFLLYIFICFFRAVFAGVLDYFIMCFSYPYVKKFFCTKEVYNLKFLFKV